MLVSLSDGRRVSPSFSQDRQCPVVVDALLVIPVRSGATPNVTALRDPGCSVLRDAVLRDAGLRWLRGGEVVIAPPWA